MANYLDIKDARLYLESILQSSKETYKVLRQYYEIIVEDFETLLQQEDIQAEACKAQLMEKLNIFNRKFTDIEKFIEEEIVSHCEVQELEDGWLTVTEAKHHSLSMTQTEGFNKAF